MSYWHMTFTGGYATTEADNLDHAKEILMEDRGMVALSVSPIPYPRGGELRNPGKCPAFCYGGRACVGKTSCPKNPCCTN